MDFSSEQEKFLALLAWSTESKQVDGRDYPRFLDHAKDTLRKAVGALPGLEDTLGTTMAAVLSCEPVDQIALMFEKLRLLASEAYDVDLDPVLERVVLPASGDRRFHVSGMVPPSRRKVFLTLYLGFDLMSLAILPFILTHELVCHVAAGHTGQYESTDDLSAKEYFSEGFMDHASHYLLLKWLDTEPGPALTPAGHVSVGHSHYYSGRRTHAFDAGDSAWHTCRSAVGQWLKASGHPAAASASEAVLRAALALNTCCYDIRGKDRFVDLARLAESRVVNHFVQVAAADLPAKELFEEALRATRP
jgi:hypothetical protein